MHPFTFVHAADLHLDSPFVGIGNLPHDQEHVVRTLREATFGAFEAVIDLCLDRQADFLLVAGDVYDGADRSLRAQLRFRDGLQRLADRGIRTFLVHGNHDPLDGWSHALTMPDTVHIFQDRLDSMTFEKQGAAVARIHGISYPNRKISQDFGKEMKRSGDEPFQIGLFHCNAGGDPRHDPYAPRSVADLEAAKLDYWALGHIHERTTLRAAEPFIGYPGNTQGRHINESGPRGCLVVNVDARGRLACVPEFVPTDQVRWQASVQDIAGLGTLDELLDAVDSEMDILQEESGGRPVVTRLTIQGRGTLHHELARTETLEHLQDELRGRSVQRAPFVWIERLVLRTRSEINLADRRAGQDFLADLLKLFDDVRASDEAIQGLGDALRDLYQHRNGKRFLDSPDESWFREVLDEAEMLCADLLAEDD